MACAIIFSSPLFAYIIFAQYEWGIQEGQTYGGSTRFATVVVISTADLACEPARGTDRMVDQTGQVA